jgi:uncharacterized membrane protein required for colicin V production
LRAETSLRDVRRSGCTEQFCNEIPRSCEANACYGHPVGAIAASIDSTPGQVFADALLVVAIAVNVYLGWSHGLIRRVFTAVGVFLACFAASNLGNAIAALIHSHSADANAWAFTAVFLFVVIVMEVLGTLLNERLQKIVVAPFDRIGGAIAGGVVGVAEVLILFLVAISVGGASTVNQSTMTQDIHAATLSGQVVRLEPQVRTLFGPVLPSNLGDHFAQNAVVITPPV